MILTVILNANPKRQDFEERGYLPFSRILKKYV